MYILLYLFWIVLNGKLTPEILITGAVLTALIGLFFKAAAGYGLRRDLRFLKKAPIFLLYVFILLAEILKACAGVIGVILSAGKNIEPELVSFDPGLKTEFGRFVLANSITLTPGTITVDVQDGVFTVHCLKRSFLDISENSVFLRWIRRLEA